MRKRWVFFILFFYFDSVQAQNLVPNPSFEDVIFYPYIPSPNFIFSPIEEYVTNWFDSPLYFNSTHFFSVINVMPGTFHHPHSATPGFGHPKDGQSMVGLYTYASNYNGRSLIGVKLNEEIKKDDFFELEFSIISARRVRFFSSNFGALLTKEDIRNVPLVDIISSEPNFIVEEIVNDTINWSTYKVILKANDDYNYLWFTSFGDYTQIQSSICNQNLGEISSLFSNYAYYYLDDVSVVHIPYNPYIEGDTLICKGESTQLTVRGEMKWAWAKADIPNQIISTDSVITVNPTVTTTYLHYGFGDTLSFTVEVQDPPQVNLPESYSYCQGYYVEIEAETNDEVTWLWQTGDTTSGITTTTPGEYWLKAMQGVCTLNLSTRVIELTPPAPLIPNDTVICQRDTILVDASWPGAVYSWSDGSDSSVQVITDAGYYVLKIQNMCGFADYQFGVEKIDCGCYVHVPNSFTPNGDGINDGYRAESDCRFRQFSLQIYDRWGNAVFESTNPESYWDGTFRGMEAPQGIYVVKVFYEGLNNEGFLSKSNFLEV